MYKLLIADDEALEREAIRHIVNEYLEVDFEIREAANGREAIEQALAFQPDLIFFDIKMPGVNGLKAAGRIRAAFPECRFVFLTAYHEFHYAQEAVSLGADEYVTKPASAKTIVAVIRKALAGIDGTRARDRLQEETLHKLNQVSQYLREELPIMIALGGIDEQSLREYFEILDHYPAGFLFVILSIAASGDDVTELGRAAMKKPILTTIRAALAEAGAEFLAGSAGREVFVLLLFAELPAEYDARVAEIDLFSTVKDRVLDEHGVTLNIGISELGRDVGTVYDAYLQAKFTLSYDATPGAVLSYADIAKENRGALYPFHKERLLVESILQGNEEPALKLADEIFEWLSNRTAGLEPLKQRTYELLLILIREVMVHSGFSENPPDNEALRTELVNMASGRQLASLVRNFVIARIAELSRAKLSRANVLLSKATAYLEANYTRELSLEEVAEAIQISPFYLSKLFKKELGQNFIDYLTGIRIRSATAILGDPLKTVKDACFGVGYRDPNYFARVFKKCTGLTPSEYRAQVLR